MEDKLKQLKSIKHFSLTEAERALLRGKLARMIQQYPATEHQSLLQRVLHHGLQLALTSFLFLVFIGGSVSAVANSSLPGDPLYTFKINVNEEVKGLLVKGSEEEIVWQQTRIENRLRETKLLAQQQTLTKEKQAVLQKALSTHTSKLTTELSTLSASKPQVALKATAKIEASLQVEKGELESAITDEKTEEKEAMLKAVNDTLTSLSNEENRILKQELDQLSTEVGSNILIDQVSDAITGSVPEKTTTEVKDPTKVQPTPPVTPAGP